MRRRSWKRRPNCPQDLLRLYRSMGFRTLCDLAQGIAAVILCQTCRHTRLMMGRLQCLHMHMLSGSL